jgi:hypothetical protein
MRPAHGILFLVMSIILIIGASGLKKRTLPEPVPPAVAAAQLLQAEAVSAKYNLGWYGNWCGGGHGGYQDCCNGTGCPACLTNVSNTCNAGELEDWQGCSPSKECLEQCPVVDDMDSACAYHDSCCIRNRLPASLPSCYPEGNYCWCDCNLVANVRSVPCDTWSCWSFRSLLIQAFEYSVACWAYPTDEWTGQPYCDGVYNRKQPIDLYCNATGPSVTV